MTQDEIIRMAQEAEVPHSELWSPDEDVVWLKRFATLVAAHEREACAKVCDDIDTESMIQNWKSVDECAKDCAAAIRARGENGTA